MAKLTLAIEDLAVESFQTIPEASGRGTVAAAGWSEPDCADTFYDGGCPTHETACPYESCMVNSQCCPSRDPTCLFTCLQTCRDCGGLSLGPCYPTEIC